MVCDASARMSPYARPWQRLCGWLIDGVIALVVILVSVAAGLGLGGFFPVVFPVVALWMYFAFLESSARQGTLAKMLLGERVTDLEGRPISFGRATARHFAMYCSLVSPIGIGFLMAFWTKRHQALHDYISSTLVTRSAGP
jgi:uncharacterized RDD family membrane protein YckC